MLLTLSTTHQPATDLGYLLAKHPSRTQSFPLGFGQAHLFYPEATEKRCTAVLLLELDPVALVRGSGGPGGEGGPLSQYVNDRPYVASSFLSVALSQVLGSALNGTSRDRPELAATPIPLEAGIPVLPCRGGERVLRALFEPLGYAVKAARIPLEDPILKEEMSHYYDVTLSATCLLKDLLTHLYVLLPVLDDAKHYYVGESERDKLLSRGEGWLAKHPEKNLIVDRYLRHRSQLIKQTLAQLISEESPELEEREADQAEAEANLEARVSLNEERLQAVLEAIRETGVTSVIDLGCGEGRLLKYLLKERHLEKIGGMDVSHRALEIAHRRLRVDEMPEQARARISLFQGSLTYRDERLKGYEAACIVEVIEHLEPDRLLAFERSVFESARPRVVIVTTPNVDYNGCFPTLPAGQLRHPDHRFEWSKEEFEQWARAAATRYGYRVSFKGIGLEVPSVGTPTQMGVFCV